MGKLSNRILSFLFSQDILVLPKNRSIQQLLERIGASTESRGVALYNFSDEKHSPLVPQYQCGYLPPFVSSRDAVSLAGSFPREGFLYKEASSKTRGFLITKKEIKHHLSHLSREVYQIGIFPILDKEKHIGFLVCIFDEKSFLNRIKKRYFWTEIGELFTQTILFFEGLHQAFEEQRQDALDTISREMQIKMNTTAPVMHSRFQVYAGWKAKGGVHSDYLDVIWISPDRVLLVHGEVTGRSISASMNILIIKTMLRVLSSKDDNPGVLMTWTNKALCQHVESDFYSNISIVLVHTANRDIEYCTAGQPGIILFRKEGKSTQLLRSSEPPLGVDEYAVYTLKKIQVKSGDILVQFSDGITDAMNPSGTLFGIERLRKLIEENYMVSTSDLSQCIQSSLEAFRGTNSSVDDESFFITKFL